MSRRILLFLFAFLLLNSAGFRTFAVEEVIISTDCGADIDDQWAIVHSILSPQIRVLGIIGSFAPSPHNLKSTDTANCATNSERQTYRTNLPPVFAGASHSLPRDEGMINEGVRFIDKEARRFDSDRRLKILILGPATDIASALLDDPEIQNQIEVIALAFDKYPGGGDGWNVRNDVKAWQILLDSKIPVTIISGDISLYYLNVSEDEVKSRFDSLGELGRWLTDLHRRWIDANGKIFLKDIGDLQHWPIWDEAPVAVVLGNTKAELQRRPHLNDDISFSFPNRKSQSPFRYVEFIDQKKLYGNLATLVRETQSRSTNNQMRPAAAK